MDKEEKPLEYQRRIRDTKGVAQRLDLDYLKRTNFLLLLRKRATWALLAVAALAMVPLVLGLAGSHKALSTGPLSPSHAVFEGRCEVCHAVAFARVRDSACERCHDGAAHPACGQSTSAVCPAGMLPLSGRRLLGHGHNSIRPAVAQRRSRSAAPAR